MMYTGYYKDTHTHTICTHMMYTGYYKDTHTHTLHVHIYRHTLHHINDLNMTSWYMHVLHIEYPDPTHSTITHHHTQRLAISLYYGTGI